MRATDQIHRWQDGNGDACQDLLPHPVVAALLSKTSHAALPTSHRPRARRCWPRSRTAWRGTRWRSRGCWTSGLSRCCRWPRAWRSQSRATVVHPYICGCEYVGWHLNLFRLVQAAVAASSFDFSPVPTARLRRSCRCSVTAGRRRLVRGRPASGATGGRRPSPSLCNLVADRSEDLPQGHHCGRTRASCHGADPARRRAGDRRAREL